MRLRTPSEESNSVVSGMKPLPPSWIVNGCCRNKHPIAPGSYKWSGSQYRCLDCLRNADKEHQRKRRNYIPARKEHIYTVTFICGHEANFSPPPRKGDVLLCKRCDDYRGFVSKVLYKNPLLEPT